MSMVRGCSLLVLGLLVRGTLANPLTINVLQDTIPKACTSLLVEVTTGGDTPYSQVFSKGDSDLQVVIPDLPDAVVNVSVLCFPESDATGIVLANNLLKVDTTKDSMAPTIPLSNVITDIEVDTPEEITLLEGQSIDVNATALRKVYSGTLQVPTVKESWVWSPAGAVVDLMPQGAKATITGKLVGITQLSITDVEARKLFTLTVVVKGRPQ